MKDTELDLNPKDKIAKQHKELRGFAANPEGINRKGRPKNIFKTAARGLMESNVRPYWISEEIWDSLSKFEKDQYAVARAEQLVLKTYDIAISGGKGAVSAVTFLAEFCDGKAKQQVEINTNGLKDEMHNMTEAQLIEYEEQLMKNVSHTEERIIYSDDEF